MVGTDSKNSQTNHQTERAITAENRIRRIVSVRAQADGDPLGFTIICRIVHSNVGTEPTHFRQINRRYVRRRCHVGRIRWIGEDKQLQQKKFRGKVLHETKKYQPELFEMEE